MVEEDKGFIFLDVKTEDPLLNCYEGKSESNRGQWE